MLIYIILLNMLFCIPQVGMQITDKDYKNLKKVKTSQYMLYETYLGSKDSGYRCCVASVLGYHYDTFLNDNLFYGIAIFGAVAGERGGYGIAMLSGGYQKEIANNISYQIKGLLGSGGGGGLEAGGGMAIEGQLGILYKFSDKLSLNTNIGYLKFPSGTFETSIFNIGLTYTSLKLSLPY